MKRVKVVSKEARSKPGAVDGPLRVLRDLMLGGRHSRRTVEALGVSLATADRWLTALWKHVPGVRAVRSGAVTWFEWHASLRAPWDPNDRSHGVRIEWRSRPQPRIDDDRGEVLAGAREKREPRINARPKKLGKRRV